jgi:enterochelin esterase family protein
VHIVPLLAGALLLFGCTEKTPPAAGPKAERLEVGKPIEREIGPGETHVYEVVVPPDRIASGVVDQRGVDVEVRVVDPTGATIATVDSPNGAAGPEPWTTTDKKVRGNFRLEVRPLVAGATPGRYEVRIDEVITADEFVERRAALRYRSPRMLKLWREHRAEGAAAIDRFAKEMEGHTPLVEPLAGDPHGDVLVTLAFRAQPGARYVELIGGPVTGANDGSMQQFEGTNLFYITARAPRDARFTYMFREGAPRDPSATTKQIMALYAEAKPDPWNPRQTTAASLVELPGAPAQPWTKKIEGVPQGRVVERTLHSDILGEDRKLGVYLPPAFDAAAGPYPYVIVFDGEGTGLSTELLLPTPTILDNLIAQGKIPPMLAVFVAAQATRDRDLPMSAPFSDFLAKELAPWARREYRAAEDPAKVTLAGVSFGGLCAAYSALHHADVFGNVLSQSGSFWFSPGALEVEAPYRLESGGLMREVVAAPAPAKPLRVWMEVGIFEGASILAGSNQVAQNRHMRDVLIAKGHDVSYHEYSGGHDWASWRGSFADGLMHLAGAAPRP